MSSTATVLEASTFSYTCNQNQFKKYVVIKQIIDGLVDQLASIGDPN